MVHSARFVAKRRLVLLLAAHVYVICRISQKSCPIVTSTAQIELLCWLESFYHGGLCKWWDSSQEAPQVWALTFVVCWSWPPKHMQILPSSQLCSLCNSLNFIARNRQAKHSIFSPAYDARAFQKEARRRVLWALVRCTFRAVTESVCC